MNLARLLAIVLPLISCSCVGTQRAGLTTFNNGGYGDNWDRTRIIKVDGYSIIPPKEAVTLTAGKHTVTFSISYMRGNLDQPILAEVPVPVNLAANRNYRSHVHYVTGFMGILIEEMTFSGSGNQLKAGALVYSSEFSAYQHKLKQHSKTTR